MQKNRYSYLKIKEHITKRFTENLTLLKTTTETMEIF